MAMEGPGVFRGLSDDLAPGLDSSIMSPPLRFVRLDRKGLRVGIMVGWVVGTVYGVHCCVYSFVSTLESGPTKLQATGEAGNKVERVWTALPLVMLSDSQSL